MSKKKTRIPIDLEGPAFTFADGRLFAVMEHASRVKSDIVIDINHPEDSELAKKCRTKGGKARFSGDVRFQDGFHQTEIALRRESAIALYMLLGSVLSRKGGVMNDDSRVIEEANVIKFVEKMKVSAATGPTERKFVQPIPFFIRGEFATNQLIELMSRDFKNVRVVDGVACPELHFERE